MDGHPDYRAVWEITRPVLLDLGWGIVVLAVVAGVVAACGRSNDPRFRRGLRRWLLALALLAWAAFTARLLVGA